MDGGARAGAEPVHADLLFRMSLRHAFIALLAAIGLGVALFFAIVWRPALPPLAPENAMRFDAALIRHGGDLAALGNCISCHTAQGGAAYAGGRPLPTPFGTIYASNITPDPETGIGRWSEAAFRRAMREGVDRAGRHLYPAFPYDHFTIVTDSDDAALYAFLMTRRPVVASRPANALIFPLQFRPLLAGWKLLFFNPHPFAPDAAHDAEWNRGAYLVEGLGHCGACHTPRNLLGAERTAMDLAGGKAEGWDAVALNHQSPAPVPWTVDSLDAYLRQGWQADHGTARGPMAEVTAELAGAPAADVQAIAVYIADRMGVRGAPAPVALPREAPPQEAGQQVVAAAEPASGGEAIYAAACASCHQSGRPPPLGGLDLHLSTPVSAPGPADLAQIVLNGVPAEPGARGGMMPGFRGVLTDAQVASLLAVLRARFSSAPPWHDLPADIARARASQDTPRARASQQESAR